MYKIGHKLIYLLESEKNSKFTCIYVYMQVDFFFFLPFMCCAAPMSYVSISTALLNLLHHHNMYIYKLSFQFKRVCGTQKRPMMQTSNFAACIYIYIHIFVFILYLMESHEIIFVKNVLFWIRWKWIFKWNYGIQQQW